MQETSTKPYLIRALHQWCSDNGYTPHLAVAVLDSKVRVPMEFVKDGEIVLNISYTATRALELGDDWITFSARFGGISRDIAIPVYAVVSIFSRETGGGMSFPPEPPKDEPPPPPEPDDKPKGKPKLQIVK